MRVNEPNIDSKQVANEQNHVSVAKKLPIAYELELHRVVEQAAYLKAERDGFRDSPFNYWLAAENEEQKYP